MSMKIPALFVIGIVMIGIAKGSTLGYTAKDIQTYQELPCLTVGGVCVLTSNCPKGKQAPVKGLCPLQQKNNVECCFSLPISETRCQKNGGECMEKKQQCPDNLTFLRATDCNADEKCCILVK